MRKMVTTVLLCGISFSAMGLSVPPPPLPPVNWEADADPRFTPPVEEIILTSTNRYGQPDAETIQAAWEAWGIEALDVLQALAQKPAWEPFQRRISVIFYACPLDAGLPLLAAELTRLADRLAAHGPEGEPVSAFNSALELAAARSTDLLMPLLVHEEDMVRYLSALRLLNHQRAMSPALMSVFEGLATSDSADARKYAVQLWQALPGKEHFARALKIAETVSPEFLEQTKAYQLRMAPTLRAREPMALILEKEAP